MKPVTIVGAGPVGLATALSLAHQGIPVQVIEQEPALTMDQRAGSYHPPTLEMLAPFDAPIDSHDAARKHHDEARPARDDAVAQHSRQHAGRRRKSECDSCGGWRDDDPPLEAAGVSGAGRCIHVAAAL